ncbi:hypothetical protein D9758_003822 [Tetrapyrgos nigripes]|uniref:HTH CENPB-type domain-containing protein n=1 Tax=Tetrapyrgos nigripes TaxID=182062 RepID=A0A8H5GLT3_9AGAR|nr:hypothetical protein D9758_003822 [Tetrapyrgos nigripes]
MKLTTAQEQVLIAWIKEKGWRFVPLSLTIVAQHASVISSRPIGKNWVMHFRTWHQAELQAQWAGGIEKCRAQALNPVTTAEYFMELKEITTTYNIKPSNIWNMNERGAMMGKGERTMVLVDRDQKDVKILEDRDHEMVINIECILNPGIIFRGLRHDLSWGKENPCGAR